MSLCRQCGQQTAKSSYIYCSNKCQMDQRYSEYILKWKEGELDGSRGINAKNISRHVERFLREKYGNTCSLCGWNKINPITGKVPLEIDHVDGDSENNEENNLRLICPNCHSLTPNFRNLNKGMGRKWRKLKYIKTG